MGSSPCGSSTETVCSPHSPDLSGMAALLAASSSAQNTITRAGATSCPCLHPCPCWRANASIYTSLKFLLLLTRKPCQISLRGAHNLIAGMSVSEQGCCTHCLRSKRSCRHMTISFLAWSATMYLMAGSVGISRRSLKGNLCGMYALCTWSSHFLIAFMIMLVGRNGIRHIESWKSRMPQDCTKQVCTLPADTATHLCWRPAGHLAQLPYS